MVGLGRSRHLPRIFVSFHFYMWQARVRFVDVYMILKDVGNQGDIDVELRVN